MTFTASIAVLEPHQGIAITPDGTKAYVANYGGGTNLLSVIDIASSTVAANIPVGTSPTGVAVTPDGTKVYVANSGANTVSVINTSTNTVIATPATGANPVHIAMCPATIASVSAECKKNVFLTQTELINLITWTVPTGGPIPTQFKIYRDAALTQLIATIPFGQPQKFKDHNRKKKQTYSYFVISESGLGIIGRATVTITTCG